MSDNSHVMGLFNDEDKAVNAVRELKKRDPDWKIESVHGPIPSHKIFKALGMRRSGVGWFTLFGGIIGFFTGYSLAAYTATQWNLIVSGKKIVSLIPFFVIGFECTILFGVLGTVLGLLLLSRLPEHKSLKRYDERCSGDHFGILATCDREDTGKLEGFFREIGGETRLFSEESA